MLEVKPRLSQILKERDKTQAWLADKAGIPQAAVSRFDRSRQHSDLHLFAISRALGVTIEDLFLVTNFGYTDFDTE